MTNYKWQIFLDKVEDFNDLKNVVSVVTLTLVADDSDIRRLKSTSVLLDLPNKNNFTNYEELTEEQVVLWALEKLGEKEIANLKLLLSEEINKTKEFNLNFDQTNFNTFLPPWTKRNLTEQANRI